MNSALGKLRIMVLGYLVRGPLGGLAWHHLQYVLGLAQMGHDVYFLEDSGDYESCYDPAKDRMGKDPSYGLDFATRCFQLVGLEDRWAYYDAHTTSWRGPLSRRAVELCESADLLLNLSAVNPLRPWCLEVPSRVLVDTDPGFTQLRHLADPAARREAAAHTDFFSFGESFSAPGCRIPSDGLPWQATRQPVVTDYWPVLRGNPVGRFTTVMQWDSYPARTHGNLRLGMKSDSFQPYWNLPTQVNEQFELALGSRSAPREELRASGWYVCDSRKPTRDPWTYQAYIQQSKAEFSVAKHGYVVTSSGWFSERSAAYLSSGRPVLVQDTGFTDWLAADRGVLAFTSLDEAIAGIERINRDYNAHCTAAREIADQFFRASTVLTRMLDAIGRVAVPVRDAKSEKTG